jgi:hypothetical protein
MILFYLILVYEKQFLSILEAIILEKIIPIMNNFNINNIVKDIKRYEMLFLCNIYVK